MSNKMQDRHTPLCYSSHKFTLINHGCQVLTENAHQSIFYTFGWPTISTLLQEANTRDFLHGWQIFAE